MLTLTGERTFPTITKIAKAIRTLRIQGAEHIAKAAIKSILSAVQSSKIHDSQKLVQLLAQGRKELEEARITEPALKNAMKYIFEIDSVVKSNDQNLSDTKERIVKKCLELLTEEQTWTSDIEQCSEKLIKDNIIVYTHCHSSETVRILIKAKKQGKKFIVVNTETRPLYQGRITAKELADAGIEIIHHVDSAMYREIKKSNLVLLGCDAVTKEGIYNKIGSAIVCDIAKQFRVPVVICTPTWKYSSTPVSIEQRSPEEIWPKAPKNIKIHNPAFEIAEKQKISRMVSEYGITDFNTFVRNAEKKWGKNLDTK